jgi:predicted acetylornithine/succinylornithine family transaminase
MSEDHRSVMMHNYAPAPVTFVRGAGCILIDDRGTEYLDFLAGIAVCSLGHAHPEVAAAVADQASRLVHVSNLFWNDLGPRLGSEVDRLLGGAGRVFFSNSGAEANEAAFKLARRFGGPDRRRIISTHGSFHGRTMGALAATGQPAKQDPFRPLPPGFVQVAYDDLLAVEIELAAGDVAAVIVEPIQGENGVVVPSPGYLAGLAGLCRSHGALIMVDEVQTGLGRTGLWFAFQADGVRPDVVTLAKALGNGMPIGACWATEAVADAFRPGDHATTFGGQPLAARAALSVLAVMERDNLPARAAEVGEYLAAGLASLPGVTEVRGRGLLLGAVLADPVAAVVTERALAGGLVVNAVRDNVIRLAPPLIVTGVEIDRALEILDAALEGVA